MTLNNEFILAQKAKLETEKERLLKEIDSIDDYPELGSSDEDNSQEVDTLTGNVAMEQPLKSELTQVTNALKAIEAGKYGICSRCGQDIDQDRLIAYPGATQCQKCAR